MIVGADVSNSTGANRVRGDQVREHTEFGQIMGMHEQDRVTAMINALGTLPGRKTVLFVTTGMSLTGDPDMFQKILANANSHGITAGADRIAEPATDQQKRHSRPNATEQQAG